LLAFFTFLWWRKSRRARVEVEAEPESSPKPAKEPQREPKEEKEKEPDDTEAQSPPVKDEGEVPEGTSSIEML